MQDSAGQRFAACPRPRRQHRSPSSLPPIYAAARVVAAQMVGKVPVSVDDLNIDLMSISGHKLYGPKGIGALYVRRKPRVRLEALISGGGQERGLRSGTLPHPLVAGLGAACSIAQAEMDNDKAWVDHLSKRLSDGIMNKIPHVILNGDPKHRYPGESGWKCGCCGFPSRAHAACVYDFNGTDNVCYAHPFFPLLQAT